MGGERGYNPEIAREAARESAGNEMARKERSFLDTLRQGAERHRMALSLLFAGALAESMSGQASAQEAGKKSVAVEMDPTDGLEIFPDKVLLNEKREYAAHFEDIRAPFIYIEGFKEKYRVMFSGTNEANQHPDGTIERLIVLNPEQVRANDLTGLNNHRLIITEGVATFSTWESKGMQKDRKYSSAGKVRTEERAETAVYASDGVENDIEHARSFKVKGWGSTEQKALLSALQNAGSFLGSLDKSYIIDIGATTIKSKQVGPTIIYTGRSENHVVHYGSSQAASVIEGFSVLNTETRDRGDGEDEFVITIEGLGSSLIMEPLSE